MKNLPCYFSEQFTGVFTVPDDIYNEIAQRMRAHFQLNSRTVEVRLGGVVCIEPESEAKQNEFLRERGGQGRWSYLLVTSEHKTESGYIYGFVQVDDCPYPFRRLINAIYAKNKNLKAYVNATGEHAGLIELGLSEVAA